MRKKQVSFGVIHVGIITSYAVCNVAVMTSLLEL